MPLVYAGQRITGGVLSQDWTDADTSSHTVTAASLTNLSTSYSIPANDAQAGTAYRLKAFGNGTWGSTQQGLTFQNTTGAAGFGSATCAGASFDVNTSIRWTAELVVIIATTGSSGTAYGYVEGKISVTAPTGLSSTLNGLPFIGTSIVAQTFNTTTANSMVLQANWNATTGSPTVTCVGTTFEKLGG